MATRRWRVIGSSAVVGTLLALSGCTNDSDQTAGAAPPAPQAPSKVAYIVQQTADELGTAKLRRTVNLRDLATRLSHSVLQVTSHGEIEVILHAASPTGASERADLMSLGARISEELQPAAHLPNNVGMIQAWLPHDKLAQAAQLPWVAAITPPSYPGVNHHPTNPIDSEGTTQLNADDAHDQGVDGAGVTVGVMSDGVTNLAASQARDELPDNCPATPCVNVLNAGNGDEGTAMLEIVHDMAPGANLLFQASFNGVVGHVNGFNTLAANGANVITEDLAFDAEPAFQQGLTVTTGDTLAANGVSIHSSAGNRGTNHADRVLAAGTGGTPDGVTFTGTPTGCSNVPDNVVAIAPGGDTTFDLVLGASTAFTLQWSEPRAIFPTTGQGGFTDLNLYIMDAGLTRCLGQSVAVQGNGVGDTIEQVVINAPNSAGTAVKIVVDVQNAPAGVTVPTLDLRWRGSQSETDAPTQAGSLDPQANYTGLAHGVAAVRTTGFIEPFTGAGPVMLGLSTQCPGGAAGPCGIGVPGPGPAIIPGASPDIAATDGNSVSGVGNFGAGTCPAPNPGGQGQCLFFGTSAAAPHAAGCDALVREVFGAASPVAAINTQLASTATDIGAPGYDEVVGFGLLNCFSALGPPVARCQNVTVAADATCSANVTAAQVDDGSTDPQGSALTLSLDNPGPFPLGSTPVTLSVSDGTLTSTCVATITVNDVNPPVFPNPPGPVTADTCAGEGVLVSLPEPVATDDCDSDPEVTGRVISVTPPLPVVGGQVFLPPGVHTVEWTADDGFSTTTITQTVTVRQALFASHEFVLRDRARVLTTTGSLATVGNSGTGLTQLGVEARSGTILSVARVELRDRALVEGFIRSASSVLRGNNTTVTGSVSPFSALSLPPVPDLSGITFPAPGANRIFNPTPAPVTLAPGSYGSVILNSGAVVRLTAGDYYMTSLTANSGTLQIDDSAGTVRLFIRTTLAFRGLFVDTNGGLTNMVLGYAGTADAILEAPFVGTLLAPNGRLVFGTGSATLFRGRYFGRALEVRPDTRLICDPTVRSL